MDCEPFPGTEYFVTSSVRHYSSHILTFTEVDAIICLGDVLNTREVVSVRAQSSALEMFREMRRKMPGSTLPIKKSLILSSLFSEVPIHVILGNHDMNLKHSRKVDIYLLPFATHW